MHKWSILLPGAASALLFAACAAPTAPAPTGQTGDSNGQPKSGGAMTVRIANDPFDWDLSYVGKSIPNGDGQAFIYSSLLGFKSGPDVRYDELILAPELAEKWTVSPDGKTFTFNLRPGVKFADKAPVNGRALTSTDVKWSYEYWSRTGEFKDKRLPTAQFAWMFDGVQSVEAPNATTVVVRFEEPYAPFLNYAASDFNPVVPREIYDKDGHLKTQNAGSGPFQLDEASSQKGSRWILKKNPTYYEPGKPYLDEIRWLVIPDDSTASAAFRTKQLDILGGSGRLGLQQSQDVIKAVPNATHFEYSDPAPMHFYINARKKPLEDVRVRRAMAYAIDPDEFIRVLFQGKGRRAMAGVFPDAFSQDEIKAIQKFDLAESKKLLAEAGFANGLELEFIFPGKSYGEAYITSMELLQAQLKKAGINMTLKSQEKAVESEAKKTGDYTLTHTSKSLESDVDSYLFNVFHPSSKGNYGGTNDPALTELLLSQRREIDPKKRMEIVKQAGKRIYDQAHALALYAGVQYQHWHPYVKNYGPNFGGTGWPLTDVWIDGR
ncbi:MAG: ABC transporter substrate-binding protein [Dehalococcoidia bacterium]|nr:ABC transporter substrate-binding protein [Dehalococcoidia bacterium]